MSEWVGGWVGAVCVRVRVSLIDGSTIESAMYWSSPTLCIECILLAPTPTDSPTGGAKGGRGGARTGAKAKPTHDKSAQKLAREKLKQQQQKQQAGTLARAVK
jgi:hypothetical protein